MYSCAAVLWRLAQRRIDLKGRVLDLASLARASKEWD